MYRKCCIFSYTVANDDYQQKSQYGSVFFGVNEIAWRHSATCCIAWLVDRSPRKCIAVSHSRKKLTPTEKTIMGWSSTTTIQFWKEYRKHECLWDNGHPLYKDKSARQAAELSIYSAMGIPDLDVKSKIRVLRNTYCNALYRINTKKTNGDEDYESTLPWFSIAHEFLKNIVQLKNTDYSFVVSGNVIIWTVVAFMEVFEELKVTWCHIVRERDAVWRKSDTSGVTSFTSLEFVYAAPNLRI